MDLVAHHRAGLLVNSGADERVAKADLSHPEIYEHRRHSRRQRFEFDFFAKQQCACIQHLSERSAVIFRDDQQQCARDRRQTPDTCKESPLQTSGQRKPMRLAGLGAAVPARQFDQRQWIARGLVEKTLPQIVRQVGRLGIQQSLRRGSVERRQFVSRRFQRREGVLRTAARRHQKDDRIRSYPTGDEGEHIAAWRVQPLHVVRHNQDGFAGCALRQQREGRQGDKKHVRRRGPVAQTECRLQGRALALGQGVDLLQDRSQRLLQGAVGQVRF